MVQDNCTTPLPYMIPCPSDGAEEVYGEYYDTAGNYHYIGVISGEHTIKDGET